MGEKLTAAQQRVMDEAVSRRPVAGNDDGWLSLSDISRPTIWALVRKGYLETWQKGPCPSGAQMHRITESGRRALDAARRDA